MESRTETDAGLSPEAFLACPHCDALHRAREMAPGATRRAACAATSAATRKSLLHAHHAVGAVGCCCPAPAFCPIPSIRAAGLSHKSSVFDAALAFSGPILAPLSLAVMFLIVLIPIARVALILYTLVPLARGRPAARFAPQAFRLAEHLRPWSMSEIFVIGTAVALVKVAGLATIGFGPAFWAFAALVIVVILEDTFMCKWTIWTAIGRSTRPS